MIPFRLNHETQSFCSLTVEGRDFDELVLYGRTVKGKPRVLAHVEVMDTNAIWLQVGDAYIWITDAKDGPVVSIRRGEYGPAVGLTEYQSPSGAWIALGHERPKAARKTRAKKMKKKGEF